MFITGICNNPFTLLSRQLGVEMRMINEEFCELYNEQGHHPDKELDLSVERHYNTTLDRLAEWRAHHGNDVSLESKLVYLCFGCGVAVAVDMMFCDGSFLEKLGDLHKQLVAEERQGQEFSEV